MPLTRRRQLEDASKLYTDFTGHKAAHVYDFPSPTGKPLTGALFGRLDFLGVVGPDGKKRWVDFRDADQPGIAASHDGRQLYIAGKVKMPDLPGKKVSAGLDLGTIFAVAYTTRRDGKVEAYRHDFRPHSRPRLTLNKRGFLILAGGAYQFKDSGINDR